jgi:CelD/BcsL family acetyltransferase involved in cellulose biosynthesis
MVENDVIELVSLRMLMNWKSDQYRRNSWIDIFARPWIADLVNYLFSIRSERFAGLLSVLYAEETPDQAAPDALPRRG